MASIVYNAAFKEHRVEYRKSSAIELGSRSSVGGSALMIFRETFFNVTFSGRSISIYGDIISPRSVNAGTALVSGENAFIDDVPTTVTLNSGGLLYKSRELPEGLHSLSFSNVSNIFIDYMLVTPGNQKEILGETLLIDVDDSSLFFEGDWIRGTQHLGSSAHESKSSVPVTNSTMRSDSPGASVSFSFTGTSVSAFGLCDQEKDIPSVDVYLDGVFTPKTASNSKEIGRTVFPCFSTSGLSKSNHILKLQLVNNGVSNDSARAKLTIDYFTYVASFRSFATKSVLNNNHTAPTNEVLFHPTPTTSPSLKPSGARLAGLIFGVIGIALFLALLIMRRRIFKRRIRPPPDVVVPFALGGRRKEVMAKETPRQHQRDLPSNISNSPLRGILKKESESPPVQEIKASPHEAKPANTGKTISTEMEPIMLPNKKDNSSQQSSDQAPPV